MKWGDFDFSEFQEMADKVEAAVNEERLMQSAQRIINEAAKALKRMAEEMTPVSPGGSGGWLRENWRRTKVMRRGDDFVVKIYNNVEYAAWVEYGHRQRPGRFVPGYWVGDEFVYDPEAEGGMALKQSWVKGQFMLTIATAEVEKLLPTIADKESRRLLMEIFGS